MNRYQVRYGKSGALLFSGLSETPEGLFDTFLKEFVCRGLTEIIDSNNLPYLENFYVTKSGSKKKIKLDLSKY